MGAWAGEWEEERSEKGKKLEAVSVSRVVSDFLSLSCSLFVAPEIPTFSLHTCVIFAIGGYVFVLWCFLFCFVLGVFLLGTTIGQWKIFLISKTAVPVHDGRWRWRWGCILLFKAPTRPLTPPRKNNLFRSAHRVFRLENVLFFFFQFFAGTAIPGGREVQDRGASRVRLPPNSWYGVYVCIAL